MFELDSVTFPWTLVIVILFFSLYKHKSLIMALEKVAGSLIGYYLVIIGAQLTPYTLTPLNRFMQNNFGINGGILNSEVFGSLLLMKFSAIGFPILFLAFLFNIFLAKITRIKGVYITSHHFLYLSLFTVFLLESYFVFSPILVVIVGSVFLGIWSYGTVVTTSIITRRITNLKGIGLANSCAGACLIGVAVGRISGNTNMKYDTDPIEKGKIASQAPIMAFGGTFLIYFLLVLVAGPTNAKNVFWTNQPWIISCFVNSLLYGAQVSLLISGVRMLVSSIASIFWDLANRIIPQFTVGLDASMLISTSPRAWHKGFVYCLVGGVLSQLFMLITGMTFIPLLSITSSYFAGGVAGVCGNEFGGRLGTHLAGLLTGIVMSFLIGLMMMNFGEFSQLGIAFGETDYGTYGLLIQLISRLLK